ncbi:universal stress protein [Corynebacterium uberis]|uniref:universal stress protein n=1 Tax=Corynebacterium TaxID=1716 RepID=UPI001D0B0465|nr:universal stress protein [Corynebacterium uberis]MCZ9310330.1 universal stress protein [Corynebacterium sp. c6VSa_13]UDL73358.1 universal stress protein [Corynebacterium uberis]UDL75764.1 universal stress protein [Corynebacterium uberis]UDL77976.1 universal stress protein [Corynebacterium uberis]UDL80259.1 universal stress protein [Corynebacterium uberis]
MTNPQPAPAQPTPPEWSDPARLLVAWRPGERRDALEYAAWLARTAPARVRVATTFVRPWPATSLKKLGGKYRKWYTQQAHACRAAVQKALRAAELPEQCWDESVSAFVDGPSEHQLLAGAAEKFGADLIVLGSQAAAPKGHILASTAADALLHSSTQPVALAPRGLKVAKRGVRRVTFAYLNPDHDERDPALLAAAQRAHAWGLGLRIVAFSPSGIADKPGGDAFELGQELFDDWREHSLAMLDRARDYVAGQFPDMELESTVATGDGWEGAVEALKWKKGDVLCLGSTPVGPFQRVFVGTEATEFLPHVPVPVIVYPTP